MTSTSDSRAPWRSIHFVPANVPKFVEKALSLEADAFQIDLEDSVPDSEKRAAREALPGVIERLATTGADILVRINRPLGLAVRDVEMAVCTQVSALSMTKVDGPSHVRLIDELVGECEQRAGMEIGHTGLIVIVETAAAFAEMRAIASASSRVIGMMLGSEDLAADLGAVALDEVLQVPKQQMIIAARAAGVTPLGYIGSIANFRDEAAFGAMVERSRQFGFAGGTSIHPSQISALNRAFGPQAAEVDTARRIVEAAEQASEAGRGSYIVDGRMVDAPGLRAARATLRMVDRLAARTALRQEQRAAVFSKQ